MVASNAFGRQVVVPLVNKSGGSVAAGDFVYLGDGATADSFTTGTTSGYTGGIGVAQETIASNATGRVLVSGYAALVNVNASVTINHFAKGYTVAKQATDAGSSRGAGTCGIFLTGGTTPDAIIWQPDLGAGSGSNPGATLQKVTRTAGNVTLTHNTTTMTEASSALRVTIAAATGDVLLVGMRAMFNNTSGGETAMDLATIVSGSIVNQCTGATKFGMAYNGTTALIGWSGSLYYVVQSGDISGGNVIVSPTFIASHASTDSTLQANANYSCSVWAMNMKQ